MNIEDLMSHYDDISINRYHRPGYYYEDDITKYTFTGKRTGYNTYEIYKTEASSLKMLFESIQKRIKNDRSI